MWLKSYFLYSLMSLQHNYFLNVQNKYANQYSWLIFLCSNKHSKGFYVTRDAAAHSLGHRHWSNTFNLIKWFNLGQNVLWPAENLKKLLVDSHRQDICCTEFSKNASLISDHYLPSTSKSKLLWLWQSFYTDSLLLKLCVWGHVQINKQITHTWYINNTQYKKYCTVNKNQLNILVTSCWRFYYMISSIHHKVHL